MEVHEDYYISEVSKSFFSLEPSHDILVALINANKHFNQENLLSKTVRHSIIQKYPNKTDYNKKFLKQLITVLENSGVEVIEPIYDEYFACLSNVLPNDYYYRHYIIGNQCIVIKNNYNLISEGTTGLCVWEGSLILSEWCLQNQEKLRNKIILELGCGVGLTGILTILHCNCKKYIFTDCNENVLNVLKHNIDINILENNDSLCNTNVEGTIHNLGTAKANIEMLKQPDSLCNTDVEETIHHIGIANVNNEKLKQPDRLCNTYIKGTVYHCESYEANSSTKDYNNANVQSVHCFTRRVQNKSPEIYGSNDIDTHGKFQHSFKNTTIYVRNLSFEQISRLDPNNIICDYILASDIIYDCDLFPSLTSALINIFNSNKKCSAIFVCKIRNVNTLESFINFIKQTNLLAIQKENINYETLKLIHDQKDICSQVEIFSIRGKPSS